MLKAICRRLISDVFARDHVTVKAYPSPEDGRLIVSAISKADSPVHLSSLVHLHAPCTSLATYGLCSSKRNPVVGKKTAFVLVGFCSDGTGHPHLTLRPSPPRNVVRQRNLSWSMSYKSQKTSRHHTSCFQSALQMLLLTYLHIKDCR